MSKDFLTLKDAANRLGSPSSTNMNFIHLDYVKENNELLTLILSKLNTLLNK